MEKVEDAELRDMVAELEEYFENAGFANVYEKKLKEMSEVEIQELYNKVFGEKNE